MSSHLKIFVLVIVLGIAGIVGYKYFLPVWQDRTQRETSDAASEHGALTVGVDSWVGYFPLCSPTMTKRMRAAGYALRCEDDKADYAARFRRLNEGELQLAVATVDAYVLNGVQSQYPGAIVAVLDQSKGGDALVARRSVAANLDALKKQSKLRVAFTLNSPSEHLLKAVGVHFDVPQFRDRKGAWRIPANGSNDALTKLQKGESDLAVLWEPDVSRALADPEFVKLIGTDDTDSLIVDILIASRALVRDKPEAIAVVLDQYFKTLREYRDDEGLLRAQLRSYAHVDESQASAMLRGVSWATLTDNGTYWLGVSAPGAAGEQQLIDTINASTQILVAAGDFDRSPLPDRDPYRLTNGQFIATLYKSQVGQTGDTSASLQKSFDALDEKGWSRLQEVGTLKVEPIGFQRGAAALEMDAEGVLARMAERLRHYPKYRILVKGHTSVGGDAEANLELSKLRAEAVASHLLTTYNIDANRVRAVGFGSSQPLPRQAGESDRAYSYRLPRVEVALLAESY
ncbi:MAG TPA: phosphate ABC transporter substrate-binding/OmpA family protein [Steroidobacteraceae bacterium]|nr:phosphate ABC transporter substrate-binding/OmpA family protein [Steroidobacteraceae bacterium]